MWLERKRNGGASFFKGNLSRLSKKNLVTYMHPVKIAQGNYGVRKGAAYIFGSAYYFHKSDFSLPEWPDFSSPWPMEL